MQEPGKPRQGGPHELRVILAAQRQRSRRNNNNKAAKWGDMMRAVVDTRWHILDRVPSASDESRWLRSAATDALKLAVMAIALVSGAATSSRAADNEILIGNTMPYSGPAAAYGVIGKTVADFFNKVNAEGGINGRKIHFISYDDAYNAQKTVELTRKLVEDDKVQLIFGSLGTAPNTAVRPYLNANKIPQLFLATGASTWDQPHDFPWTMGFQPSYQAEAHIYAQYLLEAHANGGKVAILSQDDDFGRDYVKGLKDGLGGKIPIVAEATYKVKIGRAHV